MSADQSLRLEVTDYQDACHWRWRLTDAGGAFLADHAVSLDSDQTEYLGFLDLEGYLRRYAAPDKWPQAEEDLLREAGAWIGERVFGPVGDAILRHGTPATVRVIVPPGEAEGLLYRPLEIAHAGGRPLALQDVSLVCEVAEEVPPVVHRAIGDRLRVLAVFSLPTEASTLSLRRERYELTRLLHRVSRTHRLAIELQVLQYGVTQDRLGGVLEDGEGWDVLHFSGHGEAAALVLEREDGSAEEVTTDQLCQLIHRARGRVKLVTLSACLSAAATIAETRRWLHIASEEEQAKAATQANVSDAPPAIQAVARAVVRDLGCAVLAMRFPVGDDFAIGLVERLYEGLLGKRQTLTRALQLALPATLGSRFHPGVPPLSMATPALFGRPAAALAFRPPMAKEPSFSLAPAGMHGFPPEPARFVGRSGPMARACATVAPESRRTGILFHGMAGGGKTACALELAYRYRSDRFEGMVWYQAPEEGKGIETALRDLAVAMESQLPGLAMVHAVGDEAALDAWLPRLTELLENASLLIVLDNLESLLDEHGRWRDRRWEKLVAALLAHDGLSRTVLTSRHLPAGLDGEWVLVEAISALSLNESVVLARESPNLGRLLRGEGVALDHGRGLVYETLRLVQGHPKLIELADKQAADPDRLAQYLAQARSTWAGGEGTLAAFFEKGETALDARAFLGALSAWTNLVSAGLPEASRTLFHFLCALEEDDRNAPVLESNWGDLWRRLERPGEAPSFAETLAPVVAAGLVAVQEAGEDTFVYRVHPGVAEAGRRAAGEALQTAADAEAAAFWVTIFRRSMEDEASGGSSLIVHAGLHAAPCLMRLGEWEMAATVLEGVLRRDGSPATAAGVVPLLRHVAAATEGTVEGLENAGVLAGALAAAGQAAEAQAIMRAVADRAQALGEFRLASGVTADLINLLRDEGRSREALELTDRKKEYTQRAGLGPWSQLADEARRLQLLNAMGEHKDVLSAAERLRDRMRELPEEGGQPEAVLPWNVREGILGVGRSAAMQLGRWQEALTLNADDIASKEARGAPVREVARIRYNDYGPLLRLKRYEEARALLLYCWELYERDRDVDGLSQTFTGLADLEDELQHGKQAVEYECTALRYSYASGDPEGCSISHHNLATYLGKAGAAAQRMLAHRVAAGVIRTQTQSGLLPRTILILAQELAAFPPGQVPVPASFDELCETVEQTEGVRFRELFARLPKRFATGDEALQAVLALAQQAQAVIAEEGGDEGDE